MPGLTAMKGNMIYREEKFKDIITELRPLLIKHYEEIAHYQDIPLVADDEKYVKLTDMGVYRLFTARTEVGELTGYQGFMISHNIHYSSSLQAVEDVLFVFGPRRGFGAAFIRYGDDELKKSGVQVVYRHVKVKHNHGKILTRDGYEQIDLIFGKRLDLDQT